MTKNDSAAKAFILKVSCGENSTVLMKSRVALGVGGRTSGELERTVNKARKEKKRRLRRRRGGSRSARSDICRIFICRNAFYTELQAETEFLVAGTLSSFPFR